MISALKKLARKNDDSKNPSSMPSGVSSMGQSLQRKFCRGVQYNMKIVIKGERNTGKSTLSARFQGKSFKEEYIPTREIQVCSINWSYRVADDVVKVEVWDVVDKGKRKKSDADGLKLENNAANNEQIPGILDAELVDVYKGAHGCIMLLDITKQWTFKYIERELPKVPKHIPVLILSNFLDMLEHRVIQRDEIESFVKYFDRGEDAAILQYGECCLKNGFGLKFIHKFFNIPFLILQRETLLRQVEINKDDMQVTLEELSFQRETQEQDYDKFLLYMQKKNNEKRKSTLPPPADDVAKSVSKASSVATVQSSTSSTKKERISSMANTLDDFIPEDKIDSGFLEENEKPMKVNPIDDNNTDDSENETSGNPMVSAFQDISSDDDGDNDDVVNDREKPEKQVKLQQSLQQKPVVSTLNVDIELTSDESDIENETVEEQETRNTDIISKKNSSDPEVDPEPAVHEVMKTKNDLVFMEEDDRFMDAWLDSSSNDPKEINIKTSKTGGSGRSSLSATDLDMFEASQLSFNHSHNTNKPIKVQDHSPCDEPTEEKKKYRSKDGEEDKRKHRSKHKHKKKSKMKDSEEQTDSKHKSKKNERYNKSKSHEGIGTNYESF